MARYKDYSYSQGKFIPIFFEKQILPGTFEYTLNHLIDNELDLSVFDEQFQNDETGAPAYDPRILLKIVLYAYSRGIVSSRKIAVESLLYRAQCKEDTPVWVCVCVMCRNKEKKPKQSKNMRWLYGLNERQ